MKDHIQVRSNDVRDVEVTKDSENYSSAQNGKNNNPCRILDLDVFASEAVDAFTGQAVHLAKKGLNIDTSNINGTNKECDEKPRDIIRGASNDWAWLKVCHACTAVHLDLSAAYHDYFCQVAECDEWMTGALEDVLGSFETSRLKGDTVDVYDMVAEMKDVLLSYTWWQGRVEKLYDASKNVYPLLLRHESLEKPVDARMLCDYGDGQVKLSEGEMVSLVDNSESKWKIITENGEEVSMPALTVVIPPPADDDASNTASRQLMQLLALWRMSVKRLSHQMVAYFLIGFKDWDDREVGYLQKLDADTRDEITDVCDAIEELLQPWLSNDDDYTELESRLSRLRLILEEDRDSDDETDHKNHTTVVVQTKLLRKLLSKYKDFCDYWDAYKQSVESLMPSTLIILPAETETANYVTSGLFYKFLDKDLEEVDDQMNKEVTVVLYETPEEPFERTISSEVNLTTSEESAETDQIETSVQEDQTTFTIENVLDPRNNERLTLDEAISAGVFDQERGVYRNPDTGYEVSIAEALNCGKILASFKSARRVREEKSSVGLITIKTRRETRPYEIMQVLDPVTDHGLTLQEAIDAGFYDEVTGEYVTENGERMSVVNAIDSGCITVEYRGDGSDSTETVSRTYAVHAVVNQTNRSTVSFAEAVALGIVDRDTGNYYNSAKGESVHVSEAIKRGFIKARVVDDDKSLDISPENTIVVERIKRAKDKLFKSMRFGKAIREAK